MFRRLGLSVIIVASCGSFRATDPPGGPADASTPDSDRSDAASAVPFCPRPDAWICDDFEGAAGFRVPWQKDDADGLTTVDVREVTGAPSPAHALLVATPADQTEPTDAFVFATTPSPVETLRMEARVQVVESGDEAMIVGIDTPEDQWLRLLADGRLIQASSSDGGSRFRTLGTVLPFAPGPWTHVVLTVDFTSREGSLTVGELTVPFELDASWAPMVVDVRFGLDDASPEKSWSVHYDDVLVTMR